MNPHLRFVLRHPKLLSIAGIGSLAGLMLASSCRPAAPTLETVIARPWSPVSIGRPISGQPWISHVRIVDLDTDGTLDIVVCDARANTVSWLRRNDSLGYDEQVLAEGLPACVRAEPVDLDRDGDTDLVVACMGAVFPNNDLIGSVQLLENNGRGVFTTRILISGLARVCDVQPADFNADGRIDLAVAAFGYNQGEVLWLEQLTDGGFTPHSLLPLAGAINVCIGDFSGNGRPDIATVVSQEWEEIHLFENQGGHFTGRVLWGARNEDFGSSGLAAADLNRDGRLDLVYTNGDGFDLAKPSARQWHGVQWLENRGHARFRYHRIIDLPGAYTPTITDINADGWPDIAVVSAFNDWQDHSSTSWLILHNNRNDRFAPHVAARAPTHLLALDAGDLDGDGRPEIVSGGFHAYPPHDRMSRLLCWRPHSP